MGVAENVGDTLTYKILMEDNMTVIHRSVVRPAEDEDHPNLRVKWHLDEESNPLSPQLAARVTLRKM